MAASILQIIIVIGILVSFILESIGFLWPHWWKSVNSSQPELTFPLYSPIYCIGDVCYSAYVRPLSLFPSPVWIVAGILFGGIGVFSLMSAIITQAWFMYKGSSRVVHIITITFLALSALVTFISSFIFLDGFGAMSAAYQKNRDEDSLSYNSLPVAMMLLSAITSVVLSVVSAVSCRSSSRGEMDFKNNLM